jgi:putative addiction module component (TIGR02574 family)
MTQETARLLQQALQLPENERADLAGHLLDSLEDDLSPVDEAAWNAELQRRLDEIDNGEVRPIPWAEAQRMILDTDDPSKP